MRKIVPTMLLTTTALAMAAPSAGAVPALSSDLMELSSSFYQEEQPSPSGHWETVLLNRINQERTARGLPPVQYSAELESDARGWAEKMSADNIFVNDPAIEVNGQKEGIWTSLHTDTPEGAFQEMMNTNYEYSRILDPNHRHVGIAAAYNADRDQWYIVQRFV